MTSPVDRLREVASACEAAAKVLGKIKEELTVINRTTLLSIAQDAATDALRFLEDAAAFLAQVVRERDEARAAGAIEGALFEREKWEKFAQIEREYQAMLKEFDARATGAEQMQKLLAETAAAAERQLAEAREQIDRYREMYKDGVAVAEGHYARAAAAERQLAEARAALRTSHCPRPWRGDDHTVGQCVERKHCGCDNDRALLSGETT